MTAKKKIPSVAKKFENDAGEVTKSVSAPIETIQAMLVAGISTYEQLEQLEKSDPDHA